MFSGHTIFSYYLSVVLLIFCFLGDGMEVDSEEGMGGGVGAPLGGQRTVFARLGHAGLSPLVLGEVSYREQQLYLNSLYHQVWHTTQFLWTGYSGMKTSKETIWFCQL